MKAIALMAAVAALLAPVAGARSGAAALRQPKTLAYEVIDLGAGNFAQSINEHGVVAGWRSFGSGFVYTDGVMTSIDMAGYSINDRGTVAGSRYDVFEHATLWSDGDIEDLTPLPGAPFGIGVAFGLNERGEAAGRALVNTPGGSRDRAVMWDRDGTPHDLGTLGASFSWAAAINDKGQVVGTSALEDFGHSRAFLWEDGEMRDLGTFGGPGANALDINKHGEIVGVANTDSGGAHPFLYRNGELVDLGVLPDWGDQGIATAINDKGDVVGENVGPEGGGQAFIHRDGTWIDLNTLIPDGGDLELASVSDINDRGEIVGWGWNDGSQHGYLLRPVR